MKTISLFLAFAFAFAFAFVGCASKPPKPKYMEEKNIPKFATGRAFTEKPDEVLRAARAVLDSLTKESDPPTADALKENESTVQTGWVYGIAKDKYVRYDYNGSPRRKPLAVRHTYSYSVTPSLAGSQVAMSVEEEIQEVDLKTGAEKGWKKVQVDPAVYDMLLHRLRERIRQDQ